MELKKLSGIIRGRVVAELEEVADRLEMRFTDGSALITERTTEGVSVVLHEVSYGTRGGKNQPTRRQREYLDFIRAYMARHGTSPAESDIHEHFMVSAPTAHEMVKTLERRGFITRNRDLFGNIVPRSIRVVFD